MVTLAEVKAFLRISDTDATRDALISTLIPIAYADIVSECNNYFRAPDYDITSDDIYFDVTGTTYKILLDAGGFTAMGYPTGGNIIVSGSRLNDGIFTISAQADTYLQTTEAIVDETQTTTGYDVTVALTNFPAQLKLIASRMIGYQLKNSNAPGLVSLHLGNLTEAYRSVVNAYPDEILNSLRPWKFHRTGRGGMIWHVNENRRYFDKDLTAYEGE
jgi:hypothetical protein